MVTTRQTGFLAEVLPPAQLREHVLGAFSAADGEALLRSAAAAARVGGWELGPHLPGWGGVNRLKLKFPLS